MTKRLINSCLVGVLVAVLAAGSALASPKEAAKEESPEATIKAHVSAILLKLKVDSRTQAVIQLGKINMAMVA